MRDEALERGKRLDGRRFDEIRAINDRGRRAARTHGSAVFQRGETQALVTATLGTAEDQQKIETVDGETWKRFMLHYNFPPFSVGEVQFLRGPGRREIGHGALAERSLAPMIPAEETFPYTVRVVSDILESNGSSSMASVCGGSLAMMDAGVPLKAPVAGVAMGLIMDEETGKYAVLSDIAGAEDHYGDMDFKVAGSGQVSPRCRWTSRWPASRWTSCARRSSRRAAGPPAGDGAGHGDRPGRRTGADRAGRPRRAGTRAGRRGPANGTDGDAPSSAPAPPPSDEPPVAVYVDLALVDRLGAGVPVRLGRSHRGGRPSGRTRPRAPDPAAGWRRSP